MENEFRTETVMQKKEKLAMNIEQLIENDLSLPDYCGDIVKILGCTAQTNIFSASVTGDKAVIDGIVVVRVLYVDASAKTEVYEISSPFNRSVDVKNASDSDMVDVSCVSEQISCRAVNQRRADIRGSVTLRVQVSGADVSTIITETPENLCHTLNCSADGNYLKCCKASDFTLSEMSEPNEKLRNAKIVRTASLPVVNEIKTIKNKMMIKGNVATDITFLSSSGNFFSERVNIPVSQILDIDGIDEESQCCVIMKVQSTDVRISPDTPSAPPSAEVSVVVCAITDAFAKSEITAVAEAYSPHCELICQTGKLSCIPAIIRVNENHTVTAKHDFASCKATGIADVAVKKIRHTIHTENKSVMLKGNIHFGIIVTNEDGEKHYFERITDFEYKKQTNDEITNCEFNPILSLNSIDSSIAPDGTVTIHTEIRIDGFLYLSEEMNVISSIETGEEIKRDCEDSVITVYFASKGERLWDIAREHNTSVGLIKSLNSVAEDKLEKDCMLIFEQE